MSAASEPDERSAPAKRRASEAVGEFEGRSPSKGNDAALFLLRYVEGLSNQELADEFQLEKNNVAVRLHRIRLRLQTEMER